MSSDRREYKNEWDGERRKQERDVQISPVADPARRLRAESDPFLFLETYFPDRFTDPWTDDRRRMVSEIRQRAKFGGDKAIAAPRGEGKTSFAECEVGVDAILTGLLRFPVIVAATGPDAERILTNIKADYETKEDLIADYPEVCGPVVALEGAPQRCNMQTVNGERTRMKWSGNIVVFPTVTLAWCPSCYWPEPIERASHMECPKCGKTFRPWKSKASGRVIMTRGLDAAVRGLRVGNLRPDFVLIDDPETRESAKSPSQIEHRTKTIEQDIGGLGGPRKRVARLMLTTIMNTQSLSASFTDRSQKPSWDGDRMRIVERWPNAKDKWEQYVEIRQEGMQEDPPDKTGRRAHQFYLDDKEAMDAGCVVSNPYRFNTDILEDGSQREVSTIQHVHNELADKGSDYVFCELQNEPPEEDTKEGSHLTLGIVTGSNLKYQSRLTKAKAGVVPGGTEFLTAFVDVQHDRLYYEVCAWQDRARRHVIDYGLFGRDISGKNLRVDEATLQRLLALHALWRDAPYLSTNGDPVPLNLVLVDSGDQATTVYTACLLIGQNWLPSKGSSPYHIPAKSTSGGMIRKSRRGDPWHFSRQIHEGRWINLVMFDVDEFKQRTKSAWFIEPVEDPPNCIHLFGEDPPEHREYGAQICSAKFERWFEEGKGWKEKWIEGAINHFWDTSVGNTLARSVAMDMRSKPDGGSWSDLARAKRG